MLKKLALAGVCAVFILGAFSPSALAVTVGPPRLQYTVNPGESFEGKMFLMNEGSEEATFYSSFERFTEDNGQKVFTREASDLSTWFRMANQITLKSREQQFIPFKIEVPRDAAPGGHFAVVWWGTAPPGDDNKQVAIVTRAGVLVYLTVTGDIKESGQFEEFSADRVGPFWNPKQIVLSWVFKNTGNVSIEPTGVITVKNLFGRTVATMPANKNLAAILPQSRKGFSSAWEDNSFRFGVYHAVVDLKYGRGETPITASRWFWVLPWQGLLVLFLVLFFVFAAPSFIRRYNRWIIGKARRGS